MGVYGKEAGISLFLLGPHIKDTQEPVPSPWPLCGIERAEQTSRCDSFPAFLCSTRLLSLGLFIGSCSRELRHPGTRGSLVPSALLRSCCPFPGSWCPPPAPSIPLWNGSCTFRGVVALQELGELINNLFPCQAERAASLALSARAALFPGESCFPSRALLTEPA